MSVEFDESGLDQNPSPQYQSRRILGEPETPQMVKLVAKAGVSKEYAYKVLFGIAIAAVTVGLFLLLRTYYRPIPQLSPEEQQRAIDIVKQGQQVQEEYEY